MTHPVPGLDELISMNHEIASLVRAGIPLELGLKGLSSGEQAKLSRLTDRLAERLSTGQSLADALADEGPAVSPIYASVVKAGLASGNLAQALESLAISGQIIQEMRRHVAIAAIYPVICLIVAYVEFCFFISIISPRIQMSQMLLPSSWTIEILQVLYENHRYFTIVIPLIVLTLVVVLFLFRHGLTRGPWRQITSFHWLIGSGLNWAQFTELLSLQLAYGTPLALAMVTAADSTDDRRLQREARDVANRLTGGESLSDSLQSACSLPPLVRWMIAAGAKQGGLVETLRQLSDTYRRRVLRRAGIVKVWLPVIVTICFTGGLVLAYGLAFFIPLRMFLMGLMQE